jgi:sRNA-binding protein
MKGKTSSEERIRAETFLRERYPKTFFLPGEVKPLEIGIKGKLIADIKDILPESIPLRAIYVALHYYCCTKEYKKARRTLGNPRVNLAGEIVGQVIEADLELGKQRNAETKKVKADKKARERILEQAKLEKQAQAERTAAKKAAKVAVSKVQTAKVTAKAVPKVRKNHKMQSVRTAVKSPSAAPIPKPRVQSSTTQPVITVRKRKLLSLPKKDKKTDG